MKISRERGAWSFVLLLLIAMTGTACDRDPPKKSAPDEPVENDSQFEVCFPDNDWECTAQSVEDIDTWFVAMTPYFDLPRRSLRLFGKWIDLVNELDSNEAVAPATGPIRPTDKLSGEEHLFVLNLIDPAQPLGDSILRIQDDLRWDLQQELDSRRQRDEEEPGTVGLVLRAEEPMKKVVVVLNELQYADFTDFLLLLQSDEEATVPEGVEPVPTSLTKRVDDLLERDIQRYLNGDRRFLADPGDDELRSATTEIIDDCEGFQEIFRRLEFLAPHNRLEHFTTNVGSAWQECGCDGDLEFLIAAILETRLEEPVGIVEFSLSPEGSPVTYSLDDTWQNVVDRLQDHHGEDVYLELRNADGGEPDGEEAMWEDIRLPLVIDGTTELVGEIDIEDLGVAEALSVDFDADSDEIARLFEDARSVNDTRAGSIEDDAGVSVGRGTGGMGMATGDGDGYGRVEGLGRDGANVSMTTGPVEVDGALEVASVERVFGARDKALKHCFERELQQNSELSGGEFALEWVIDESGLVQELLFSTDTIGNDGVTRCLERVVERMRFPTTDDGTSVDVEYSVSFSL